MGRVGTLLFAFLASANLAVAESHAILQMIGASATTVIDGKRASATDFPEALHIKMFVQGGTAPQLTGKCSGVALGQCVVSAAHCLQPKDPSSKLVQMTARTPEGYAGEIELGSIRTPKAWSDGLPKDKTPSTFADLAIARLSSLPPNTLALDNVLPLSASKLEGQLLQAAAYGTMYDAKKLGEDLANLPSEQKRGAAVGQLLLKHREVNIPHRIIGDLRGYKGIGDIYLSEELLKFEKVKEQLIKQGGLASPLDLLSADNDIAIAWKEVLDFEKSYREANSTFLMTPAPSSSRPGDSGSPLFLTRDGKRSFVGVIQGMKNPEKSVLLSEQSDKIPDGASAAVLFENHYKWLLDQVKDLKCFEVKASPSSMGEIK